LVDRIIQRSSTQRSIRPAPLPVLHVDPTSMPAYPFSSPPSDTISGIRNRTRRVPDLMINATSRESLTMGPMSLFATPLQSNQNNDTGSFDNSTLIAADDLSQMARPLTTKNNATIDETHEHIHKTSPGVDVNFDDDDDYPNPEDVDINSLLD
jgi:hypothetical protein